MSRRPKPANDDNSSTGEWIVTYSDTITLLLCFFVLLFAFSTVNEKKWQSLVESFGDKSGAGIGTSLSKSTSSSISNSNITPINYFNENLYKRIKSYIDENELQSSIELIKGENQIILRFKDTILFDPDKAILKEEGKNILSNICDALKISYDLIDMIRVEGHTAASPKGKPEFVSTFDLSVDRAVSVLRYMDEVKELDPVKLSAIGYGQYHPIGDNETEAGRMKNRRVEIIVTEAMK
jgi:chemotaxis protein MotB